MISILIRTIAILVTSYLTGVGVTIAYGWNTLLTAIVVAIVLAIINHTIKPLLHIISLPITVLTLGLFSLVINGVVIVIAAALVPGFDIPSLWMAIWYAIVLALVNWALSAFDKD
jgi:putative membrane protein